MGDLDCFSHLIYLERLRWPPVELFVILQSLLNFLNPLLSSWKVCKHNTYCLACFLSISRLYIYLTMQLIGPFVTAFVAISSLINTTTAGYTCYCSGTYGFERSHVIQLQKSLSTLRRQVCCLSGCFRARWTQESVRQHRGHQVDNGGPKHENLSVIWPGGFRLHDGVWESYLQVY